MKMTGEQRIAASRQKVWDALNDPAVLRQCIPGCQSLDKEADGRLTAVVAVKIGPIGARFAGAVTLSALNPPTSYTITGEGQGGTVGSAKGGANVQLADDNGGTLLTYEVEAQVGGRLAQLGGPIIDATARQLAGKFFQQFSAIVGPPAQAGATATGAPATTAARTPLPAQAPAARGVPWAWLLAIVVAAFIGFFIGQAPGQTDWMGLAIGLLLLLTAGIAFDYGRRTAAPTLVLDSALLARLAEGGRQ